MHTPPQQTLLQALQDPRLYDHPVERFELVETHVSWVLLTGPVAYKIKKPVDLGFLDFRTLARRRHFCAEELRLNRRLAPQLYQAVVPITGRPDAPRLGGPGEPIEYAVRMRQFPREAELDRVLEAGGLEAHHVERLAADVAAFHDAAAVAAPDSPFGTPRAVASPVLDNFEHLGDDPEVAALRCWCEEWLERLAPVLDARHGAGRVRECHGDMHLANMVLLDDRVVVFDCLEFDEALRWIDVMSELAFVLMDLDYRARPDLGRRFLNAYLSHTGDYAGLRTLGLYRVYRALVRAKVAAIQRAQHAEGGPDLDARRARHLALAAAYAAPAPPPRLVITHGPSGAGKSVAAGALVAGMGAVQIRADVERKRLHGLPALARSHSAPGEALYTQAATDRTYARLRALAREALEAGFSAVLDATFLDRAQRAQCRALAEALAVPFVILDVRAPPEVLDHRVRTRRGDASEATRSVLARQLETLEPLAEAERAVAVAVDGRAPVDAAALAAAVRAVPA